MVISSVKAHVYTIQLHGAFGLVQPAALTSLLLEVTGLQPRHAGKTAHPDAQTGAQQTTPT